MTAKDFRVKTGLEVAANVAIGGEISNVSAVNFYVEHSDGAPPEGHLCWNAQDGTLSLGLAGSNVVLQTGQETLAYVKNTSANTIVNGSAVAHTSAQDGRLIVQPFIADGTFLPEEFLGVATEDIAPSAIGYVTTYGYVRNFDTSSFNVGDIVYVSAGTAGALTTDIPISPNVKTVVGSVTDASANGSIFVDRFIIPLASDVTYNNTSSNLIATNLQAAVDELQLSKASVDLLNSSINLYPTTAASNVASYNRMVSSTTDADYDDTAANVATGAITTTDQLIASLIADADLFVGNPGVLNITTIGNIAKTAGNKNSFAEFFFSLYKRNAAGSEELLGTSSTTGPVNPDILDLYQQFSASSILNNGEFLSSDRLVIKYFANAIEGTASEYQFQFGGTSPVRALVPVPVSVIPSGDANEILVDTSTFNSLLSGADSTVQAALETLDDHSHSTDEIVEASNLYYTIPRANSAIDARVTNTFINALTIDADTLGGQSSSFFTGYTDSAIAALVDSSPATLDTLNELAAALGDDPNFATTVSTQIGLKLDSASFTGANILANLLSVDGSGSGLDADLLDGQQGSYYLDYNNFSNVPAISNATITVTAGSGLTTGGTFTLNQSSNSTITLTHADTSSQASLTTLTGTNVVSDIDLDGFGHVTSLATRALSLSDFDTNLSSFVSIFTLPTSDGSAGQALTTNGAGVLSFTTLQGYSDSNVDLHLNTASAANNQVLSWTGADYDWVDQGAGGGGSVTTSDTAPVLPSDGDLWFNTNDASMYFYYNDGSSSQWVAISGPQGPQGPAGGGVTTGKAIAMAIVFG